MMKNQTIKTMLHEMQDVVENNILRFWLDRMQDHENGGFYGRIDADEVLHKDAEKGAILNARILWSFSAAYRVLGKREYLEASRRAYEYFLDHFIDPDYGGVYWSVDYKGRPLDTKKQFYAIGFAIYGLSEYARATGDREALDYAISLYECIEEHAFDREHNGYIEACTREWGEMADMRLWTLMPTIPSRRTPICTSSSPIRTSIAAFARCRRQPRATMCRCWVPWIAFVIEALKWLLFVMNVIL